MTDKQDIEALLRSHRKKVDAIDIEIVDLLNQRAECARTIGEIKGTGVVYRPEREAQVLRQVQNANSGPLSDENVAWLFREIMSICLALERPLTIAYLGPEGTFNEAATIKHFGHAAKTLACSSMDAAFCMVETRTADYVVAPVDNSTEGAVDHTLDLMLSTSLSICGEVSVGAEGAPNKIVRFWVLGHEPVGPSGQDKTSLILSAQNKPGAMHALTEALARYGISMTWLASRPSPRGLPEYMSFVDLDGHQSSQNMQAALAELTNKAIFIKVLGSYPWAVL